MAGEASIRPAEDADNAGVVALWRACGLIVPWNDPEADIARCRASPQAELFVAEADGRIVATAMAGDDGHRGWLYYVAAEPASRRQGLGRRVVRRAETWLAARGVVKVELLIRGANRGVVGFYRALGFRDRDLVVMDRWLVDPPVTDLR